MDQQVVDRFWSKVEKTDGCWIWVAGRSPTGYGKFGSEKLGHLRAHRVAWELSNGPIPPGLCVCHRCDNPPCVRPDHLFVGTHLDNSRDKVSKGRQAKGDSFKHRHSTMSRGEAHGMSKLTEADVIEIRQLHIPNAKKGPRRLSSLAARYGVDKSLIGLVVNRKIWKHVR